MSDFQGEFWGLFVLLTTVASFVGLLVFISAYSTQKLGSGDTPETTQHIWDDDLQEYNNPLPRWWLNLFYITLVFGIVYLLAYPGLGSFSGILSWSQHAQYEDEVKAAEAAFNPLYDQFLQQDIKTLSTDPKARSMGKRLFATYCTNCHGSDGGGARGYPNLRDDDWLYGDAPEAIETSIAEGRNGMMPPWGKVLSSEQIANLADFILSLADGQTTTSATALAGQTVFNENCTACHQAGARGSTDLGAPNLADTIWLYGGSRQKIIESITTGRIGKMPAHGDLLGKAKGHLLAAYVYGLASTLGRQPR